MSRLLTWAIDPSSSGWRELGDQSPHCSTTRGSRETKVSSSSRDEKGCGELSIERVLSSQIRVIIMIGTCFVSFSSSFLFLVYSHSIKEGWLCPECFINIITCQLSSHGGGDGIFHLKHQRANLLPSDTFSALSGEGGREPVKLTSHVDAPKQISHTSSGLLARHELEMVWKFNCLQAVCWEQLGNQGCIVLVVRFII